MVDPLDNLDSGEQLRRLLLREEQERLDRLESRLGDDETLKGSLVPLIADVLRDAGVRDYQRLASALAPVVLRSIKTEIHNSRDMMVDALYPITGRLVAAAVRNAFKDLVDQLNQKLDSSLSFDRWQARIKAKMTGRSEAEVLLSEGAAFEITDLLLINRQSGLLLAQVGSDTDEQKMDSHLLGSILTAIMAFVRDAMHEASEQDLRTLHVGDMRLHLQVSPGAVLAIKTKGPPPTGFDGALNETFCAFLSQWGNSLSNPDELESHEETALADDLEVRFQSLLQAKQSNFRAPSKKGAILLGGLALIALGWIAWSQFDRWQAGRIERTAQAVISSQSELIGYPLRARYQRDRDVVVVTGLTPDDDIRERLQSELARAMPDVKLDFDVRALPRQKVELNGLATKDDLETWRENLRDDLSKTIDDEAGDLRTAIERVETALPTQSEREFASFQSWLGRQSLRFKEGSSFENEQAAGQILRETSRRLTALPNDIGLMIVGYADDTGGREASEKVSLERAGVVSRRLKNLGVPSKRLIDVGRNSENRISQDSGFNSANRRVEFEIFFLTSTDGIRNPSNNEDDHVTR